MKWDEIVKWLSATVGAAVGMVTGAWTGVLSCLLIMNVVDYLTGIVCAVCGRSAKSDGGHLSSTAGFVGLAKKMFIWVIIIVTTCVDRYVIGSGSSCQTAAALFYVANEALSIMENCALMGLPIPAFLRKLLEVLREKNDQGGSDVGVSAGTASAQTHGQTIQPEDNQE